MRILERQLRAADAFSITFDVWTARSLFDAYVAVLYSYLDKDFMVRVYVSSFAFTVLSHL